MGLEPNGPVFAVQIWIADGLPGPVPNAKYEGEDGDHADVDEEEEASQADDGSTQNVEN
jgi:hypothetical protein